MTTGTRRAAMERRVAHVRQIEARSVGTVRRAARPARSIDREVNQAVEGPRSRPTRPTVDRRPIVHRDAADRVPLSKPALASRPAKPDNLVVASPAVVVSGVNRPITRCAVVTPAGRPKSPSKVSILAIVARTKPEEAVLLGPAPPRRKRDRLEQGDRALKPELI